MIELNKIYVENCLATMQRMQNDFIDLVITSPPYDMLRDYKGFKFPFKHIARNLFRVLKPGGVIVWVVGDQTINGSETGTSFKQALFFMECGFKLYDTMIYAKNNCTKTHRRYEQDFEYMFIFSKGTPEVFNGLKIKTKNIGMLKKYDYITGSTKEKNSSVRSGTDRILKVNEFMLRGNIWFYPVGSNCSSKDKISFRHPATFPENLVADHVNTWSNEGNLIYDPFGGSGTTGKVCHLLNRNWILSEISNDYSKDANTRIENYTTKNLLF